MNKTPLMQTMLASVALTLLVAAPAAAADKTTSRIGAFDEGRFGASVDDQTVYTLEEIKNFAADVAEGKTTEPAGVGPAPEAERAAALARTAEQTAAQQAVDKEAAENKAINKLSKPLCGLAGDRVNTLVKDGDAFKEYSDVMLGKSASAACKKAAKAALSACAKGDAAAYAKAKAEQTTTCQPQNQVQYDTKNPVSKAMAAGGTLESPVTNAKGDTLLGKVDPITAAANKVTTSAGNALNSLTSGLTGSGSSGLMDTVKNAAANALVSQALGAATGAGSGASGSGSAATTTTSTAAECDAVSGQVSKTKDVETLATGNVETVTVTVNNCSNGSVQTVTERVVKDPSGTLVTSKTSTEVE